MKRIAPLFFAFLYFQSLLSLAEVKKLSTAEAVAGLSATRSFEFDNWEEPVIHEEAFLEDSFYAEAWVDKDLKIPKKHIKTVKKINGFFNKVKNDGRLVKFLQPEMAFDLPVGIERKVGGVSFIILIEEMKILPNSAVITASAVIEFSGRKLYFRGTDIPFSNSGGIAGTAKLALLTDQEVAVGNNQKFVFKGSRGETYLTWDCNGFKEMSLDLDLVFSRSLVIPEDANGNPDRSRQLTANLKTKIESWDDFVLSVNLPAFRLAKSPDMRFALRQAVLDMSDTKSAAGVKLPVGYLSTYYGDMGEELWKGVYIKEILVTLPRAFKKSGKPIELGANNFILDEKGVSGEFFARDVMDLDKGKLGKWRYSIEDIAVNLECSQFTEFCINGELQIPLTKEDQLFGYHAYLNAEDVYQFSVSNRKDLSFPLWGAGKVKLEPNSSVEVMIIKDDFYPAATLSGEMDINPGKVSLANIEFQELKIQTQEKPYVRAERFGVGSEKLKNMMRGFPVQVSDIELVANSEDKEEIGMHITLSVELMKASKGGFGAEGELTVWGREKPEDVISYKYSRLQFHAFEVDFRKSGTFEFFGRIEFFENDPTYGDGFQGTIKAKFIGSLELQAMALFGKHKGRSYWFVDVLAIMNQGIPIGSSGLEFVGFGGGAYYGLKQSSFAPQSKLGTKGRSQTGMVYVPDRKAGLGFKATVVISLAKNREAFTGDATFEMSFNRSGGLRQVSFYGKANIMAKSINDLNEKAFNKSMAKMAEGERMDDKKSEGIATDHSAPIFASFMMKYDANERIFDATFNVSINASAIKGNGEARLYFAPDKWFVYVGKPDAPVKLEVLGMFTSESYFMVGDEIPEPPAPPRKLMEILKEGQEVSKRDDKGLAAGRGFAFGVRAAFDSKTKFLIFYGEFSFGMGFDLMIKKYADDALCNGNSDFGIDHWYAQGQAYVYISAKIGIEVTVLLKDINVVIIEASFGVLLQIRGPNPFYFRGIVSGDFSVLGGMVTGSCKFKLTVGEACEFSESSSPLDDIQVIAELTPRDGSKEVDVFTSPQAVFNMSIDKEFTIPNYEESGPADFYFRIKVDQLRLVDKNGREVDGEVEWNEDHTVAAFKPHEILPPKAAYTFKVKLLFEERKGWNWILVPDAKEENQISFVSGTAPDYIPKSNVAYTYPVDRQMNLYIKEHGQGFIQLKQGMSYLLTDATGKWDFKAAFSDKLGNRAEEAVHYDSGSKRVSFSLPEDLDADVIYTMALNRVPKKPGQAVDRNVKTEVTTTVTGSGELENSMSVSKKKAEGSIATLSENQLYKLFCRTSKYSTLQEKIKLMPRVLGVRERIKEDVHKLTSYNDGDEYYDIFEMKGEGGMQRLIQFEADMGERNVYYQQDIYPLIYEHFRYLITKRSSIKEHGVPPSRAVWIYQHNDVELKLLEEEVLSGQLVFRQTSGRYIYDLPYDYCKDYWEAYNRISAEYVKNPGGSHAPQVHRLMDSYFPRIRGGEYPVIIRYVLPDGTVTSEFEFKIVNPFMEQ